MPSIMAELASRYRVNHDNVVDLVAELSEQRLSWKSSESAPSIGFHLWHMARWSDYLQEIINGRGSQLWESEGLARAWGLTGQGLGYAETGMEMSEAQANALRLPPKSVLLDYVRRAFAAADAAVETLSDDAFFRVYECFHGEIWHDGQIGPIVITWMTHDNRHIGMIECMVGLQGQSGSADA
jgi:hypothetical protein